MAPRMFSVAEILQPRVVEGPRIAAVDRPLSAADQALVAVWFRRLVRDAGPDPQGIPVPPHVLARIAETFDAGADA